MMSSMHSVGHVLTEDELKAVRVSLEESRGEVASLQRSLSECEEALAVIGAENHELHNTVSRLFAEQRQADVQHEDMLTALTAAKDKEKDNVVSEMLQQLKEAHESNSQLNEDKISQAMAVSAL